MAFDLFNIITPELIEQFPVLSREEEQDLFQQLEENPDGDSAREKIILSNLRLVRFWAGKIKRIYPTGILDQNDLFQEGIFGLMKSIRYFDWQMGYKFSSYAYWMISQGMVRAIKNCGRHIRIPVHIHGKISRLLRIQDKLSQELGREPLPEEVADRLNIPVEKLLRLYEVLMLGKTVSLDEPFNNDDPGSSSLLDVIPLITQDEGSGEDSGYARLRRDAIHQALDNYLTSREKLVLTKRFGLYGERPHTLQEVGDLLGITRERIRQIEGIALRKLRWNPKVWQSLKDLID